MVRWNDRLRDEGAGLSHSTYRREELTPVLEKFSYETAHISDAVIRGSARPMYLSIRQYSAICGYSTGLGFEPDVRYGSDTQILCSSLRTLPASLEWSTRDGSQRAGVDVGPTFLIGILRWPTTSNGHPMSRKKCFADRLVLIPTRRRKRERRRCAAAATELRSRCTDFVRTVTFGRIEAL